MNELHGDIVDHRIEDGDDMPEGVPEAQLHGHASVKLCATGVEVLLGTKEEFARMEVEGEGTLPRKIRSEMNAGAMSLALSAQAGEDFDVAMLMGPEGIAVYSNSGGMEGIVVFERGKPGFEIISGEVNRYTLAEARLRIGLINHYGAEFSP